MHVYVYINEITLFLPFEQQTGITKTLKNRVEYPFFQKKVYKIGIRGYNYQCENKKNRRRLNKMIRILPELNNVVLIEYLTYTNSTASEWDYLS